MNVTYFMLLRRMQILLLLCGCFMIEAMDNRSSDSHDDENAQQELISSLSQSESEQEAPKIKGWNPESTPQYSTTTAPGLPRNIVNSSKTLNNQEDGEFKISLITPTHEAIKLAQIRINALQDFINEQETKKPAITKEFQDFLTKIMQEADNLYDEAEYNDNAMMQEIIQAQKEQTDPSQYMSAIVRACQHAIKTMQAVITLHSVTIKDYSSSKGKWSLPFSGPKNHGAHPFDLFNKNINDENKNILKQLQSSLEHIQKYTTKKGQDAALAVKKYQAAQAAEQKMTDRQKIQDAKNHAEQLIQSSYFSPEMQYLVLACCSREFVINVVTGKVQNLPTIQQLIDSRPVDNNLKINALQAALEAVRIATVCAGLDAAYAQPEYLGSMPSLNIMPGVDEQLAQVLKNIKKQLDTALQTALSKRPWTTKYVWSWIPESLQNYVFINPNKMVNFNNSSVEITKTINTQDVNASNNLITIPQDLIQQIIKLNDYKQLSDATLITELLFKQIFIAQQPLPAQGNFLFEQCNLKKDNFITSTNYIFNNFNDFERLKENAIQSIADKNESNLHQQQKLYVRDAILRMRKAVQTAIYVANTHRNYYFGYSVPYLFTQYSDGAIGQLVGYENQLIAAMRDKDHNFMLPNDLARDNLWRTITITLAAGAAVSIVAAAAIDGSYGRGTTVETVSQAAQALHNKIPKIPDSFTLNNMMPSKESVVQAGQNFWNNLSSNPLSLSSSKSSDISQQNQRVVNTDSTITATSTLNEKSYLDVAFDWGTNIVLFLKDATERIPVL